MENSKKLKDLNSFEKKDKNLETCDESKLLNNQKKNIEINSQNIKDLYNNEIKIKKKENYLKNQKNGNNKENQNNQNEVFFEDHINVNSHNNIKKEKIEFSKKDQYLIKKENILAEKGIKINQLNNIIEINLKKEFPQKPYMLYTQLQKNNFFRFFQKNL
jgi:hypothetical protein